MDIFIFGICGKYTNEQTISHGKERLDKEEQYISKVPNGTADETIDMKCIAKWPLGQLRGIKVIHALLLLLAVA